MVYWFIAKGRGYKLLINVYSIAQFLDVTISVQVLLCLYFVAYRYIHKTTIVLKAVYLVIYNKNCKKGLLFQNWPVLWISLGCTLSIIYGTLDNVWTRLDLSLTTKFRTSCVDL